MGGIGPNRETERRLAELEKKLDRLIDEVSKLKEDRRPPADHDAPRR